MEIAIAGIHTGIGKTIASAIIAQALEADYWKPVQAGLEERDAALLKTLLTNGEQRIHPEALLLTQPLSPHAAAKIDGITVDHTTFAWPVTNKTLIVETAGGILSPISDTATMADFMQHYKLPAILVSQNYLGSINHTLLSIEVLKSRKIPIIGIVMSGDTNESSEAYIETYSGVPIIARIPFLKNIDAVSVKEIAGNIKDGLLKYTTHVHH